MRKITSAGCLFLLLTSVSCSSTPPVGVIVYRAKCCTEDRLLGNEMHLTAAEAKAHIEVHQREHPMHETTYFSTQMQPWNGK